MLDRACPRSHVFGREAEPGSQGVIGAMQLSVTGKQTEIGEALRRHIEASLGSTLDKYFKTAIEAHVIVSKEAHLSRAEISIHIGRGIVVNARGAASEAYLAFDAAEVEHHLALGFRFLDEFRGAVFDGEGMVRRPGAR